MRPVRLTLSSATQTPPIPIDRRIPPANHTLQTIVSAGGVLTYSVQYTTDDIQAASYLPASGNWFDVPGLSGLSASARAILSFPVTAVRLNVTAFTSGTCELDVIPSGP